MKNEYRKKMDDLYNRLKPIKRDYHGGATLTAEQEDDVRAALRLFAQMTADEDRTEVYIGRIGNLELLFRPFDLSFRAECNMTNPEIVETFRPTSTPRTREEKKVATFFYS